MGFAAAEKEILLSLKGVGETVVSRLEQIGFSSLSQLAGADPVFITRQISQMLGSSCWQNSPQAKNAIEAVVSIARDRAGGISDSQGGGAVNIKSASHIISGR